MFWWKNERDFKIYRNILWNDMAFREREPEDRRKENKKILQRLLCLVC